MVMSAGWTTEEVLENYPTLTPEGLRAAFAFARDVLMEVKFAKLVPAAG